MTTLDPRTTREIWPHASAGPLSPRRPPRHEALPKRVLATVGFLADATRRRKAGRFALWALVVALAVSGVALLGYPVYTKFYATQQQKQLVQQIEQFQGTAGIEAYKKQKIAVGKALTRLVIPKIKVDIVVVEGTSGNALRAGAGHYENTALPGEFGNVAIAGHRTGFGSPFLRLNELAPGDLVVLQTPVGKYTYQLTPAFEGHGNPWITSPRDLSVIAPTAKPSLTLTTCDPPHTSLNRLIVRALLVKTELAVPR